MRIAVVAAIRPGAQWAHVINVIKMAEGFARAGHRVCLITLRRTGNVSLKQIRADYGLSNPFKWVEVIPHTGVNLRFALASLPFVLSFRPRFVYVRNNACSVIYTRLGIRVVGESHHHPDDSNPWFHRHIECTHRKRYLKWVTINENLVKKYRCRGAADKFLVLPDAVDLALFQRRNQPTPFKGTGPHVTYAGHLYDYKGIPTLLHAAKRLPNVTFHLVGGVPEDIARQRKRIATQGIRNVVIHGLKPHSEVPHYLQHSDVLLLPPSAEHPSSMWTSPVKAGEYLAMNVPVVATAIPALKRWFSKGEVEFAAPDDPEDLARGIRSLLDNTARRRALTQKGLAWARKHTYEQRAEQIVKAVDSTSLHST